jgi:hypothetical protein
MTDRPQTRWRYAAGTWTPANETTIDGADYPHHSQSYGYNPDLCVTVYGHREDPNRWLVAVNITGDVHLVEVTSFPDLVDLTAKLAPLAAAEVLTGATDELDALILNAAEDSRQERHRRTRSHNDRHQL